MASITDLPIEVTFQIFSYLTPVSLPEKLRARYLDEIQLLDFPLRQFYVKGFTYLGVDQHPFLALSATCRHLRDYIESFCAHLSAALPPPAIAPNAATSKRPLPALAAPGLPARTHYLVARLTTCNGCHAAGIAERAFIFAGGRLCFACSERRYAGTWKARVLAAGAPLHEAAGDAWVARCDWPLEWRGHYAYWRDELPGAALERAVLGAAGADTGAAQRALERCRAFSAPQQMYPGNGFAYARARTRWCRCAVM